LRCVQTVEPLAAELGVDVEQDAALAEGTPVDRALELIAASPGAVMCSHGDVIGDLVCWLDDRGLVGTRDIDWKKASTWVLRLAGGEITHAVYEPPPRVRA
ncbi:MAG TPA: NUDIX hydrolase, partial [Candidatus Dormibacteraeota bacterium]|nr:NUDIX hydrolase [Candidatus Dormibacteraeota bacterium]